MDFVTAVKTVLQQKYATIEGRASRSEYWWFVLFCVIVNIVLGIVDGILGLGFLTLIFQLAVLVPSITLGVRRLHDLDQTGWLMLLALIPILGSIGLLIWFALPGTAGANRFGEAPVAAA